MSRLLAALLLCSAPNLAQSASVGAFELVLDPAVFEAPFSGDLFVAFAANGEPREAMHGWFGAPPVLRFEVAELAPGVARTVSSADAVAHAPADWSTVEAKPWRAQAIARRSRTGRMPGLDAGDVTSAVVELVYDPASKNAVRLTLASVVAERPFVESERVKLFEFTSPSLSKFHGFDYVLRAGVLLPKDFGAEESYPVVVSVTGFGGTYEDIRGFERRTAPGSALEQCIVVVPDATNRYGHSVFCDSPSIGPWGQALVHELLPALEEEFNGAGPEHRYVTGVSSGGWSSLWLQVAYPEAFAGCWSHCPDPIDFHDFQQIDLYTPLADGKPRNMYVDEQGQKRPLARRGADVMLLYEDFVRREHVLNPGGQIRSFEATFSPKAADGTPRRVFDVETGAIDHATAALWKPYDIANTLLTSWKELGPRLKGKIHLFAGEVDTFYLEGAVERFRAAAEAQGLLDEMQVEVIPGMPHTLHGEGQKQMESVIRERWAARAISPGR
ncbi:MAG: alpha/beta hydrolase-fold protein [Planctomycetota bacterium]